jgi:phage gpG-like protein
MMGRKMDTGSKSFPSHKTVMLTITTSIEDSLTRDLRRKLEAMQGSGRQRLLRQMGETIVSVAKRSFADSKLRGSPWPAKKDGSDSNLMRSTSLRRSVRASVSGDAVVISSDRLYAAIHQLGGTTPAHVIKPRFGKALAFGGGVFARVNHPGSVIPARPFLPFHADGSLTARAGRNVRALLQRAVEAGQAG